MQEEIKLIGRRIRLLRTAKNLTQTGLAKEMGISQTHLCNIECDKTCDECEICDGGCDGCDSECGNYCCDCCDSHCCDNNKPPEKDDKK